MKIWLRINKKQVDKVFFPWLKRYQKIPTNEIVWVNKWFGESHYRFKDLNPWHKKALKSFSALAQKALYFIGIAVHNYYLDQCCKYGNCCNQIIINNITITEPPETIDGGEFNPWEADEAGAWSPGWYDRFQYKNDAGDHVVGFLNGKKLIR